MRKTLPSPQTLFECPPLLGLEVGMRSPGEISLRALTLITRCALNRGEQHRPQAQTDLGSDPSSATLQLCSLEQVTWPL